MMKADKSKKKIIRTLFSRDFTLEERQTVTELELVEKEMQKQWEQSGKDSISPIVKKQIWSRIQRKCNGESKSKVHVELIF